MELADFVEGKTLWDLGSLVSEFWVWKYHGMGGRRNEDLDSPTTLFTANIIWNENKTLFPPSTLPVILIIGSYSLPTHSF